MVSTSNNYFLEVDPRRQLLQNNIERLYTTLRHWQLWEAEYEGLKEEIFSIDSKSGLKDLSTVCEHYDGELVTKKEVNEILRSATSRDTAQIINLLDRRIEYVERNICSVRKQIEAAKKMLTTVSTTSTSETLYEDDLPFTEIMEELDDQGNIVSSQLLTPSSSKPQLLEVLRKAGVQDLTKSMEKDVQPTISSNIPNDQTPLAATKKTVSFVDGTKLGPETNKLSPKKGRQILTQPRQKQISPCENPVIPSGESAEDAALRREMLEYGMLEVGSVVAELEVESNSDWSSDWSDQDSEEIEYSSDEEDSFGRSTRRVISDEFRQRMIELEERMGERTMKNIVNKGSDLETVQEGIGYITIPNKENSKENSMRTGRISGNFDANPSQGEAPMNSPEIESSKEPRTSQTSDISERSTKSNSTDSISCEKTTAIQGNTSNLEGLGPYSSNRSVFKSSKGRPLATTVTEREIPTMESVTEPNEMNPHLLRQEVAIEYYKIRNMMIQKQGGFMKENESERVEFTEEEGGPKKMSRFKAARLAKS
ncbi:hypothetical protein GcM1_242148 [Golovinomyces cichoracearum]|uniref:DUF3835 domain-containing protein n=1 Tax=Golovinomyces cichoracearum TaxID=62708 RepID=A0A420IHD5_9PEZI|nr:hypothetical protein GcM1_242148 [Golovinomyces cichoracearum]